MKNTANIPKIGNGLILLIEVGKSIRLKWVNELNFLKPFAANKTQLFRTKYSGLHVRLNEQPQKMLKMIDKKRFTIILRSYYNFAHLAGLHLKIIFLIF